MPRPHDQATMAPHTNPSATPTPDAAIHVCSLAALNDVVATTAASHIITVINPWSIPETPPSVEERNHLKLAVNDIISDQPGLVAPRPEHIDQLLSFVRRWNRSGPLVIHCLAGISRSSAAAFITLCEINSGVSEFTIARSVRAASRTATPNSRMVQLADKVLGRDGRMIEAIESIGNGVATFSGEPFSLDCTID